MCRKAKLFPERYQAAGLWRLRTMREWHEAITAPACGYRDADDYYYRASALRVVDQVRVPTLILAAQDDPIIPFASFRDPGILGNPYIMLVTPEHGGHCGFVSRNSGNERFWAEARVVEFCNQHSQILKGWQSKRQSSVTTRRIRHEEIVTNRNERLPTHGLQVKSADVTRYFGLTR